MNILNGTKKWFKEAFILYSSVNVKDNGMKICVMILLGQKEKVCDTPVLSRVLV